MKCYESQIQSGKDDNVKLKQLQYLLVKVLPVLRAIYTEQSRELEIEAAIRGMYVCSLVLSSSLFIFSTHGKKPVLFLGVPVTESDVAKCEIHPSVRIYWSVFQSLRTIFASSLCSSSYCLFDHDNDISFFLGKQTFPILFLVCFANRQ